MSHARATIVANEVKGLMTELMHQLDHIEGHRAFGVVGMVRQAGRLRAVSIATEIGANDPISLRQFRRDPVPANMSFGITVHKEDRFACARGDIINRCAARPDFSLLKPFKQRHPRFPYSPL